MRATPSPSTGTTSVADQAERLISARRYSQAIELCRSALGRNRTSVPVRLLLARALMHLHRDHEARLEMHECLRQDPQCQGAYRLLGELALRHDEYGKARQYLEQALVLAPQDRAAEALLDVVVTMGQGADASEEDLALLRPKQPPASCESPIWRPEGQ